MFEFLRGRGNRATYWTVLAAAAAAYVVIALLAPEPPRIQEVVLAFVCIPRLHDIGRSGWWVAAAIAGEIVAVILVMVLSPPEMAGAALGAVTLAVAGLLILLGAIPGQKEANRFGEPPAPGVQWKRPKRDA